MDSFTFRRGEARFASDSHLAPWSVVFEDEGDSGYLYAWDRSHTKEEHAILDAMLIYNNVALENPGREYLATVQWSPSGLQAVFYIEGTPQAFIDFATRRSFCRSNFPNFMEQSTDTWRKSTHAWDEAAIQHFEAELYRS